MRSEQLSVLRMYDERLAELTQLDQIWRSLSATSKISLRLSKLSGNVRQSVYTTMAEVVAEMKAFTTVLEKLNDSNG